MTNPKSANEAKTAVTTVANFDPIHLHQPRLPWRVAAEITAAARGREIRKGQIIARLFVTGRPLVLWRDCQCRFLCSGKIVAVFEM